MKQEIGFSTTRDGVRIAYATSGIGSPLVRCGGWYTHIEHDWDLSGLSEFYRRLAAKHTLVRHDMRGTGLSDRFPRDVSLDTFVADLESVVDALKLDKFPLLAVSQGGAIGVAYALKHPERVSKIIFVNALVRGAAFREGVGQGREVSEAMRALILHGWGSDDPTFRSIFTTQMMPSATPEQASNWNELERRSASAESAERIYCAIHLETNLVDRLRELRVPALIIHARNDRRVPFEEGRILAAGVPDARFVPYEGTNHVILPQDPSLDLVVREIFDYLGDPPDEKIQSKLGKVAAAVSKAAAKPEGERSVVKGVLELSGHTVAIAVAIVVVGLVAIALDFQIKYLLANGWIDRGSAIHLALTTLEYVTGALDFVLILVLVFKFFWRAVRQL